MMFSVADLTYENLTQLKNIKLNREMMKMESKDMIMILVGVIHAILL